MNHLPEFDQLVQLTLEHWRQFRPTQYADLKRAGTLQQAVEQAAQQTLDAAQSLIARGYPEWAAWEAVREEWCLLPDEEEEKLKDQAGAWADGPPLIDLQALE
jgi:hypothetical protein